MSTIQNSGGHLTYPNLPIFYAGLNTTQSLTTSYVEQANVYNQVAINRGSHYNVTTGRFTAPCAGIYEFGIASVGGQQTDTYRWRFYKNGVYMGYEYRVRTAGLDHYAPTNAEYVIQISLAADDYVSVYALSDAGNNAYGDATSIYYSYFRGRLIG